MTLELKSIGCRQSAKAVDRFQGKIGRLKSKEERHSLATELRQTIYGEMEDHLFLWIPADRSEFYTQPLPLFGETVAHRFPAADFDIEETGKCFATGRFTACVLHAMRVLELGLRSLAKVLKVQFEEKDWAKVLNEMRGEWNRREQLPNKPAAWKRDRQFYSEAFVEFRYLKDAWRNYAMHAKERYDEERAESILLHVKSFMIHLATKGKK